MTFDRYITDIMIRYAEAVYPEVRSKEFDESEHPRNEDGTFAVKGVDKSGESGIIKATRKQIDDFKKKITGTKTFDGTVITDVAPHIVDRMLQRNVSAEALKNALTNASIIYPGNKPNRHCVQSNGLRIVYSDDGVLITVIVL